MTIAEWIDHAAKKLEVAGVESAARDAALLLAHIKSVSLARLSTLEVLGERLSDEELRAAEALLDERADRVPLQHLTGRAAFRNIELEVGPGVFIPRPETEIVAQYAIDELLNDASPAPLVADLCTGSAAIALAIADEVPHAQIFALEKDESARAWAERNVTKLADGRVKLINADATVPNPQLMQHAGQFTVIISNPPYVPEDAIPRDPEVRDHDPSLALYSGTDGLDVIRAIAEVALPLVRPGGLIVLEHAEHQGRAVCDILLQKGWSNPSTHQDLTRRDRLTIARR